ncbi:DUF6612 family protein [Ligilactobacillus sp.]|uniref:DUF6612 family protein n=1 Tax=Ligilactobacillus sp. TaxID=2767921 RepID=UPI002FDF8EEA
MRRKLAVTAVTLLVACGLSACAGGGNAKKTGGSGDTTVDTEKKVSKKDRVLSEAVDAEKKVKGARIETRFFVKHTGDGHDNTVSYKTKTEYTEKPVTLKSDASIRFQEGARDNKYVLYYDGKDLYNTAMIGLTQGRSYRQAIDSAQSNYRFIVQNPNIARDYLEVMSDNKVKFNLKEEGGEYALVFRVPENPSDRLKKELLEVLGRDDATAKRLYSTDLKNVSFTNATFNVHVDKKTYEPKSFGLEMTTVVSSASGRKFTTLHSFDGKYYDVNKVERQKMPSRVDEVLK